MAENPSDYNVADDGTFTDPAILNDPLGLENFFERNKEKSLFSIYGLPDFWEEVGATDKIRTLRNQYASRGTSKKGTKKSAGKGTINARVASKLLTDIPFQSFSESVKSVTERYERYSETLKLQHGTDNVGVFTGYDLARHVAEILKSVPSTVQHYLWSQNSNKAGSTRQTQLYAKKRSDYTNDLLKKGAIAKYHVDPLEFRETMLPLHLAPRGGDFVESGEKVMMRTTFATMLFHAIYAYIVNVTIREHFIEYAEMIGSTDGVVWYNSIVGELGDYLSENGFVDGALAEQYIDRWVKYNTFRDGDVDGGPDDVEKMTSDSAKKFQTLRERLLAMVEKSSNLNLHSDGDDGNAFSESMYHTLMAEKVKLSSDMSDGDNLSGETVSKGIKGFMFPLLYKIIHTSSAIVMSVMSIIEYCETNVEYGKSFSIVNRLATEAKEAEKKKRKTSVTDEIANPSLHKGRHEKLETTIREIMAEIRRGGVVEGVRGNDGIIIPHTRNDTDILSTHLSEYSQEDIQSIAISYLGFIHTIANTTVDKFNFSGLWGRRDDNVGGNGDIDVGNPSASDVMSGITLGKRKRSDGTYGIRPLSRQRVNLGGSGRSSAEGGPDRNPLMDGDVIGHIVASIAQSKDYAITGVTRRTAYMMITDDYDDVYNLNAVHHPYKVAPIPSADQFSNDHDYAKKARRYWYDYLVGMEGAHVVRGHEQSHPARDLDRVDTVGSRANVSGEHQGSSENIIDLASPNALMGSIIYNGDDGSSHMGDDRDGGSLGEGSSRTEGGMMSIGGPTFTPVNLFLRESGQLVMNFDVDHVLGHGALESTGERLYGFRVDHHISMVNKFMSACVSLYVNSEVKDVPLTPAEIADVFKFNADLLLMDPQRHDGFVVFTGREDVTDPDAVVRSQVDHVRDSVIAPLGRFFTKLCENTQETLPQSDGAITTNMAYNKQHTTAQREILGSFLMRYFPESTVTEFHGGMKEATFLRQSVTYVAPFDVAFRVEVPIEYRQFKMYDSRSAGYLTGTAATVRINDAAAVSINRYIVLRDSHDGVKPYDMLRLRSEMLDRMVERRVPHIATGLVRSVMPLYRDAHRGRYYYYPFKFITVPWNPPLTDSNEDGDGGDRSLLPLTLETIDTDIMQRHSDVLDFIGKAHWVLMAIHARYGNRSLTQLAVADGESGALEAVSDAKSHTIFNKMAASESRQGDYMAKNSSVYRYLFDDALFERFRFDKFYFGSSFKDAIAQSTGRDNLRGGVMSILFHAISTIYKSKNVYSEADLKRVNHVYAEALNFERTATKGKKFISQEELAAFDAASQKKIAPYMSASAQRDDMGTDMAAALSSSFTVTEVPDDDSVERFEIFQDYLQQRQQQHIADPRHVSHHVKGPGSSRGGVRSPRLTVFTSDARDTFGLSDVHAVSDVEGALFDISSGRLPVQFIRTVRTHPHRPRRTTATDNDAGAVALVVHRDPARARRSTRRRPTSDGVVKCPIRVTVRLMPLRAGRGHGNNDSADAGTDATLLSRSVFTGHTVKNVARNVGSIMRHYGPRAVVKVEPVARGHADSSSTHRRQQRAEFVGLDSGTFDDIASRATGSRFAMTPAASRFNFISKCVRGVLSASNVFWISRSDVVATAAGNDDNAATIDGAPVTITARSEKAAKTHRNDHIVIYTDYPGDDVGLDNLVPVRIDTAMVNNDRSIDVWVMPRDMKVPDFSAVVSAHDGIPDNTDGYYWELRATSGSGAVVPSSPMGVFMVKRYLVKDAFRHVVPNPVSAAPRSVNHAAARDADRQEQKNLCNACREDTPGARIGCAICGGKNRNGSKVGRAVMRRPMPPATGGRRSTPGSQVGPFFSFVGASGSHTADGDHVIMISIADNTVERHYDMLRDGGATRSLLQGIGRLSLSGIVGGEARGGGGRGGASFTSADVARSIVNEIVQHGVAIERVVARNIPHVSQRDASHMAYVLGDVGADELDNDVGMVNLFLRAKVDTAAATPLFEEIDTGKRGPSERDVVVAICRRRDNVATDAVCASGGADTIGKAFFDAQLAATSPSNRDRVVGFTWSHDGMGTSAHRVFSIRPDALIRHFEPIGIHDLGSGRS